MIPVIGFDFLNEGHALFDDFVRILLLPSEDGTLSAIRVENHKNELLVHTLKCNTRFKLNCRTEFLFYTRTHLPVLSTNTFTVIEDFNANFKVNTTEASK